MKIIPIYYHLVSNTKNPLVENLYTFKDEASFKRDLEALIKRYRILDLEDIRAERGGVVLTFDDGFAECYHTIFPILKQYNLPAFFFLNNDFLDNREMFYRAKISLIISKLKYQSAATQQKIADLLGCRVSQIKRKLLTLRNSKSRLLDLLLALVGIDIAEYLLQHQPYLTSIQIREMVEAGYYFGGHTYDHLRLKGLPPEEQEFRLVDSTNDIAQRFGLDYKLCSLPHDDKGVSKEVLFRVRQRVDYIFGGYGLRQYPESNYFRRISNEHKRVRIDRYIKMWKIIEFPCNKVRFIRNILKVNKRKL